MNPNDILSLPTVGFLLIFHLFPYLFPFSIWYFGKKKKGKGRWRLRPPTSTKEEREVTHQKTQTSISRGASFVDVDQPGEPWQALERNSGNSRSHQREMSSWDKSTEVLSSRLRSPGRYQELDLFIKVLRLLCPNLTDVSFGRWLGRYAKSLREEVNFLKDFLAIAVLSFFCISRREKWWAPNL